ncbi:MAG: hypothetical protein AB7O97_19845 [Planctomycetota bacterium]
MHRSLLSLAVLASLGATVSAQCAAPTGLRTLETLFAGTTFYANATPPEYGVSMDPGTALRFDLDVDSAIDISAIGVNVLNDGGTYGPVPVPNLVGAPNGTLEFWFVPNDTVNNAVLFTSNPYTHVPPVPPIAPWQQANAGNVGNLVFAAPDTPSMASFSPPIHLAPGNYAVVLVMVPSGTNPATDRIHPLFTNVNSVPTPLTVDDGFVKFDFGGIQSPAFVNGALQYSGTPPYIPNVRIDYTLGTNVAFASPYGAGCYDRKQTFYESFAAPGAPASIDLSGSSLSYFNLGDQYLVSQSAASFPSNGVVPGSTSHYGLPGSATPTHVNTGTPGTTIWGDWDDATSVAYPLPFAFSYPGDGGVPATDVIIGSNGAIWLGNSQPTAPRFLGSYAGWLQGPPSFAVGYCDLYPSDQTTFLGGTGDMFIDSDGSSFVTISWVGVTEYPSGTSSTFQITLLPGGSVDMVWGNTVHAASDLLVGFTPGNGAADPGNGSLPQQVPDLSAATVVGYLSGDGASPAVIRLLDRPKVGNPLVFETSNVDPTVAANITVVSLNPLNGVSLSTLGMPGCSAWVALPELTTFFNVGAGPYQWNVTGSIPATFAGVDVYAQSVQFSTALNPFNQVNLLTSDAVCVHFDVN